jgi:hypothetical protein
MLRRSPDDHALCGATGIIEHLDVGAVGQSQHIAQMMCVGPRQDDFARVQFCDVDPSHAVHYQPGGVSLKVLDGPPEDCRQAIQKL